MRKIAIIAIPITIFVAGLLVVTFGLADLRSAEASVPAQQERGSGWAVENFRSIEFEAGQWDQLGGVGSCVIFRSRASIDDGVVDPATLRVTTSTEDFSLDYPNRGVRVIVCAGFTAFIPPLSAGTSPTEEDN